MKKSFAKSELGSIMIEALAMLGLIAMVTPVLYRKTAERTTELQDINTAGELRAIIKAVDDYISAHYDAITAGEKITNTCPGSNNEQDYAALKTGDNITVPLGHFCEFLPYGVLDASGAVNPTKLFSNYRVVLKTKGSEDKVVTGFVIADPSEGSQLNEMRSSSIASMIGGNGGFVSEVSGSGADATGSIRGNLGIWGIGNVKNELGVTGIQKNSVVAASIEGISSQTATINMDEVLYRKYQTDPDLNTMSTDLLMGSGTGSDPYHSIVNIDQLIVGAATGGETDALYIATGDISLNNGGINIAGGGDIVIGAGDTAGGGGLKISEGEIYMDSGTINMGGGSGTGVYLGESGENKDMDMLSVFAKTIQFYGNNFSVSNAGVVDAKEYRTLPDGAEGDNKVSIKNDLVKLDTPLRVTLNEEGCSTTQKNKCALFVDGNAYITGDLTVDNTFSAKNLHAQEKLTVGGTTAGTGTALTVEVSGESGANKSLNFAGGVISAETTTSEGNPSSHVKLNAGLIKATSGNAGIIAADKNDENYALMQYGSNDTDRSSYKASSAGLDLDSTVKIKMDAPHLYVNQYGTEAKPQYALAIDKSENSITSEVDSFKILPNSAVIPESYFEVGNTEELNVNRLDSYFTGNNNTDDRGFMYLRNYELHFENKVGDTTTPIFKMRPGKDTTAQDMEMFGRRILMQNLGTDEDKVLNIDLSSDSSTNDDYPVFIRKGAIELTEKQFNDKNITDNEDLNYVKADRFVANHKLEDKALVFYPDTLTSYGTNYPEYQVNPAYTSIMHDIKLTSRGGARLSDILPDFINKGIYVVDNSYPAAYNIVTEGCTNSKIKPYRKLKDYMKLGRSTKVNLPSCTSYHNMVSPWAGFVPTPTCPPGYSKVITLMPASFSVAQVGNLATNAKWNPSTDLESPDIKSIHDYPSVGATPDPSAPTPVYFQKNTWLKSFAVTSYKDGSNSDWSCSGTGCTFEGWDVGMGFVYPYEFYKEYYTAIKTIGDNDSSDLDLSSDVNEDLTAHSDKDLIWNLFPVYNGTLEGYATVYCYFNRKLGGSTPFWNSNLVDINYDQLDNDKFRNYDSKQGATNLNRLNSTLIDYGPW